MKLNKLEKKVYLAFAFEDCEGSDAKRLEKIERDYMTLKAGDAGESLRVYYLEHVISDNLDDVIESIKGECSDDDRRKVDEGKVARAIMRALDDNASYRAAGVLYCVR